MISVMIVDDEKWICRLISCSVPWDELGMEVVKIAENGVEATEYLKDNNIDVIITDIRMPVLDGIGLIKNAREMGLESKFIIISGYQDFEYAKSAIEYGATGYIVKPVDEDELTVLLYKIADELKLKHEKNKEERKIKEKLEKSSKHVKEQFVRLMIKNDAGTAPYIDIKSEFDFDRKSFITAVFRLDSSSGYRSENDLITFMMDKITKNIEKMLKDNNCKYACANEEQSAVFIINTDDIPVIKEKLKVIMGDLKVMVGSYRNFSLTLGIGSITDDIEKIHISYNDADRAIKYRLVTGQNKIILSDELPREEKQAALLTRQKEMFASAIETIDKKEVNDFIYEVFDIQKLKTVNPKSIFELAEEVINYFYEIIESTGYTPIVSKQEIRKHIEYSGSLKIIADNILAVIIKELENFEKEKREQFSRPVAKVKEYIAEEYKRGISLSEAAETVNLNPNYLSRLFKAETGVNFIEYLTNYRIKTAKELIKNTNIKLSQIPQKVGYLDNKHFAKTFKKIVGLTPAEYKKLYE